MLNDDFQKLSMLRTVWKVETLSKHDGKNLQRDFQGKGSGSSTLEPRRRTLLKQIK